MNRNFEGVVNCTRAFLPQLKAAKRGYLVNISSMYGIFSAPRSISYQTSKFAVRAFSEVLQLELAGFKNLSVHSVHPGFVETRLGENASGDLLQEARDMISRVSSTTSDQAATAILNGVRAGDFRILFTPEAYILDTLIRLFPGIYRFPILTQSALVPIYLFSKLASKLRDSSFGLLGDRASTGVILAILYGAVHKALGKIRPRAAL